MATIPVDDTWDSSLVNPSIKQQAQASESLLNLSIPYVYKHYGSADGIIDPTEYAFSYTDSITGITVYMEQNATVLFVGLEADTSGWIAIGWKNYTDDFKEDGLNNSDLLFGYTPGEVYDNVPRVGPSDVVSVHYVLSHRNGTILEEGDVPNDESTTPISQESLLQGYKDMIIGMRIGEVRHFIIPAKDAYNQPSHPMYGEDLEYVITLTRINSNYIDPADRSAIVYSDEYGISTFQHKTDVNQSRILAADGTDDGSTTRLEYYVQMNSTDPHDIPLLNMTDISYPFVLMYSDSEDIRDLPIQHSEWATPPQMTFIKDQAPDIMILSPEENATLGYVAKISLNITDNIYVRRTFYRMNDENWSEIIYDFKTDLWETSIDLSEYIIGVHRIWFNATDISNRTGIISVNITIERPYLPLLGMKLDITRTFSSKLYHSDEVRDEFRATNNGSAPISAIEMFMQFEYANRLLDITGIDSEDNALEIVSLEDYQGLKHWRIYMYNPIDFQESYTFTIVYHFHSIHTLTDFDENEYEVTFPRHPMLPYVIRSSQLTLAFRSGDSLFGASPEGLKNNLVPLQDEKFTFSMRSFTPLIVAERRTDVTVDPWGWLIFRETISLKNIGPTRESIFLFTCPEYTTTVTIYDEVGILADSQPGGTWDLNTTVDLQVNLQKDRFGEDGLWPGYQYTFYIDFKVKMIGYYSQESLGDRINLPMGTLGDVLITKHVVNVILPNSVGLNSASGEYRLLFGIFDTTVQYVTYNTTRYNPVQISLVYTTNITALARPAVFSLIIGLIAGLYIMYRRTDLAEDSTQITEGERFSETRQAGAPPELLSEFAKAFSRKTALAMDFEKLEAARRKGKVSKKEFMIRERDLKTQIQETDSILPSLKSDLSQHGARYRDLISQLELQDEKIEGAKAGLRQLLIRKKKQRISRAAFEKSRQDYLKTIKRATTATDRILMTIQEEAGEI